MCSLRKQIVIFCTSTNANTDYLSSLPPSQISTFLNQHEEREDPNEDLDGSRWCSDAQLQLRKKIYQKCQQKSQEGSISTGSDLTICGMNMMDKMVTSKLGSQILRDEAGCSCEMIQHILHCLQNQPEILDDLQTCVSEDVTEAQISTVEGTVPSSSLQKSEDPAESIEEIGKYSVIKKQSKLEIEISSVISCASIGEKHDPH